VKFLKTLAFLAALNLGLIAGPVFAQTPPPDQAQPSPAATAGNPVTTPAPSPMPATPQSTTTTEDIHDIRGPISIPIQWLWVLYLASALAVATALYAAWRLFRRQTAPKPKLPFEIALERLEAARALMTPDSVREYAFAVSEIVRGYIEQRFHEKAARRTTEEFLSDLLQQTGTPLAVHRSLLENFLNHCDLPKFARWQLSDRDMESMHESARAFILNTQPQPEPVQSAAPAQSELLPTP
jgi:hypothetical protein